MPKINSRNKGAKNERDLSKLFEVWTGKQFSRTPSSGGLQWGASMAKGDIVSTTEGFYFPFCIEAKFYNKIDFSHLLNPKIKNSDIISFWTQCKRDATLAKKIPLLCMRYNSLPSNFHFVVIEKDLFEYLILPFYNKDKGAYFYFQNAELDLVVITSTWFFSLDYKRLGRAFKNYADNYNEIIKPYYKNTQYKISNRGYLISHKGNKILGSKNSQGRVITAIKNKLGFRETIAIYREVATVFVKNPKNKPLVNHLLNKPEITDARNLEWVTDSENIQHYFDNVDYGYKIQKIDKETKEILGIYISPILAAKSCNKKGGSAIIKVLNGKRFTAYGFIWKKIKN